MVAPAALAAEPAFNKGLLSGTSSTRPTSLQWGPDGRLYVANQNGVIKAYTVVRSSSGSYAVSATETISLVNAMPNRDDDGRSTRRSRGGS
jgi:hypothetical protein